MDTTPNFALDLPPADRRNWTDIVNGNFTLIDAILATFVSVQNLRGVWTNNIVYNVADNVIDEDTGVVWTCQVQHTTASPPTTFLQERTNFPTYWTTFATAATNRGAWQPTTAYNRNDFVVNGSQYAVCIIAHTSSLSFANDVAAGDWSILVDLSAAGSLVLPILSAPADANKFVAVNTAGSAYIVINQATALANLGGTSVGIPILQAGSAASARTTLGLGTSATLDAGTSAGNVVQLAAGPKLPAVDGSALTNLPTSNGVTTYLTTAGIAFVTAGVFVAGPNTGSIGAAGQKWLISANATVICNGAVNDGIVIRIFDGTTDYGQLTIFMPDGATGIGAGVIQSGSLSVVVTLTGPTTFTLQGTDSNGASISGFVVSSAFGTTLKATSITAVRLS